MEQGQRIYGLEFPKGQSFLRERMSQHIVRKGDLSLLGEGLGLELDIVGMLEECFPSGSPGTLVSLNQELAQQQENDHKMAALTSKSRRTSLCVPR